MEKILRDGKLGVNELDRSVFKRLGKSYAGNKEIPFGQGIRLSMDPITVGSELSGKLAVLAAVNGLAAAGAVPYGIEMTILLPPNTPESSLRSLVDRISETAAKENVLILGGHTEVTEAVTKPVLCACGIGNGANTKSFGLPGSSILMTGSAGLEAMALLGYEKEEDLLSHFSASLAKTAKEAAEHLSIQKEAAIASSFSGTECMVGLSEGGLFAGLWSLKERTGCGLHVDLQKVPLLQEMIEIANYYDFDPYMCESAGSLLIAVEEDRKAELIEKIEEVNTPVHEIGFLTKDRKGIIRNGDETRNLDRPLPDSIRSVL